MLVLNWGGLLSTYLSGTGIDNKLSARIAGGTGPVYYHSDHLGTTTGTSNASGMLTPHGSPDSFGNSDTDFTGREYDSFTGLYYYRARMYDSQLGRFTAEDPIGFRGGDINLFGYVQNSPVEFADPYGLWPSWWRWNYHKTITERALEGRASHSEIRALANSQYPFDSATQNPAYAPWHAMARPGQNPEDARREANIFVKGRICLARNLADQGYFDDAMAYLAQAIHAMQDATSPAHHPFQQAWPNEFISNTWEWRPWGHYHTENFDPGQGSAADINTRRVYDYYRGTMSMPADLFDNSYDSAYGIRYSPYRQNQ